MDDAKDNFMTARQEGDLRTEYGYTSSGQLVSVEQYVFVEGEGGGTWVPDESFPTITYHLDALGRRIAKQVGETIVEKYLWAGYNTTLLAVYDGSDTLIARFEYGTGRLPVCMTQGSDTYYFAYDQVGSLRGVFNSSGSLVHEIRYDAWGNILFETENIGLCVPFGFACGIHDHDTGLVRFGFRDYDPRTSRWTALDPIGFSSGDVHLYGYCAGDPVNITDFLGLWGWDGGWIQYGVGGLFGFYGGTVAASGWMEMDRGLAAGIDGALPVINPFQGYYDNEDGSIDTIYHLSRLSGNISFISLCTAVTLGIGGCMANANGLGQVSTLGRFTLGRIAISETYTVGLNEFFGYGVTSLSRSLVSGILCGLIRGLAGLDAFDFVSEICDVIIGPSEPNITDSSEPNIAGPFIPKPKPKPKIKF